MITLTDPTTWPQAGSIWRHRNGNHYMVICFTNTQPERQDEYPTTIVYLNTTTSALYSRRLMDWERSMTPEPAP